MIDWADNIRCFLPKREVGRLLAVWCEVVRYQQATAEWKDGQSSQDAAAPITGGNV